MNYIAVLGKISDQADGFLLPKAAFSDSLLEN
jgi:hypothetical protein